MTRNSVYVELAERITTERERMKRRERRRRLYTWAMRATVAAGIAAVLVLWKKSYNRSYLVTG